MEDNLLTKQELYFCELFVSGDAPYAGNASKCYKEAFDIPASKATRLLASRLMKEERIKAKIEELEELMKDEHASMKAFLTENLMHIIEECSTNSYMDRRGTKLSPAPLRSVAVNASKALMELYPVKEVQKHELNIGGAGEGGITFNVIMPDQNKDTNATQEAND